MAVVMSCENDLQNLPLAKLLSRFVAAAIQLYANNNILSYTDWILTNTDPVLARLFT